MLTFLFFIIPFSICLAALFMVNVLAVFVVMLSLSCLVAVTIFYGLLFWAFLGVFIASLLWLSFLLSNVLGKRPEAKKILKFVSICLIGVLTIILIKQRFIHAEVRIINTDQNSYSNTLENFMNDY